MSQSTPTPTGRVADGPLGQEVQIVRQFHAPIDVVWAAVTESPRLERWIGRWDGDPATGHVQFFMTAEGEDVPPEAVQITECTPPHRLAVVTTSDTPDGPQQWRIRIELSHDAGITTLLFAQLLADDLASVGPGWEYYLDRLAAALGGGDPGAVVWDDYFPAMSTHYAALGEAALGEAALGEAVLGEAVLGAEQRVTGNE